MLDLDLLRSFVSVVEAGGFTRAGERVHRTQSTVSQQIRRLEDNFGRALLHRDGKRVRMTEEGERLLSYARRILALAEEARDVVSRPAGDGVIRVGLPEDFATCSLTEMLSEFARSHVNLRLSVRCAKSHRMRRALERGEIDLALLKRDAAETGGVAAWRERLRWVSSRRRPVDLRRDPLPLAVFEQGCLYRDRAIHTLEMAGRAWHVAYTSPSLAGIQAAVAAGLGVGILPEMAILPEHAVLEIADGFLPITDTAVALVAAPEANAASRRLASALAEFCDTLEPRRAA
ncbi:MAG TPA: LysR substrate-binding domain-containing protein [Stellaceae bacterium]|nr:LysR substrate-binding domain-containing protein [Stellaceae bacterium]